MSQQQVKERIQTLAASVETCIQRAEFIMRRLDTVLPEQTDAASATQQELTASQIIRSANSMANELRDILTYYRTQLASIAEDEKNGVTAEQAYARRLGQDSVDQLVKLVDRDQQPAEPAAEPDVSDAELRRRRLGEMANVQAQRAAEAVAARVQRNDPAEVEAAAARVAAQAKIREQTPLVQIPYPEPNEVNGVQGLPAPVDPSPRRIPGVRGEQLTPTLKVLSAYERMMRPSISPLSSIFAPSPWFPNGRGTITVGSEGFAKWHQHISVADRETFRDKATLPQGFYGEKPDGHGSVIPENVVIRTQDIILIWDFSFNEGAIKVFKLGLPEEFIDLELCTASVTRSIVEQLCKKFDIPNPSGMTAGRE